MARLAGYGGNVKYGAGPTTEAAVRNWTLDFVVNTGDTTGFDTSQWMTFLPLLKEWSGSFETLKDGAPISIGTVVAIELEESSTANQEWTGNVIITAIHVNTPVDGLVTYNYDFQGTAALTPASA